MADQDDPEFGIRMLGYARREVDEFVAEVRKELRVKAGGNGEVRILTTSPTGESAVARMMRLAAESADERAGDAAEHAEQTLRSARELADRLAEESSRLRAQAAEESARVRAHAAEEAAHVRAEATAEAERRVYEAKVEAEELLADARQRALELEEKVAETLEREVTARVGELSRTHSRLISGLVGMRDALVEVLDRDEGRGPISVPTLVPNQVMAE